MSRLSEILSGAMMPLRLASTSEGADWVNITEHWLAVEVLSRSSRVYDREFKRDAYFALGVRQVWLVDWREGLAEVCRAPAKTRRVRDVIEWRVGLAGLTVRIDLAEVFAGI